MCKALNNIFSMMLGFMAYHSVFYTSSGDGWIDVKTKIKMITMYQY